MVDSPADALAANVSASSRLCAAACPAAAAAASKAASAATFGLPLAAEDGLPVVAAAGLPEVAADGLPAVAAAALPGGDGKEVEDKAVEDKEVEDKEVDAKEVEDKEADDKEVEDIKDAEGMRPAAREVLPTWMRPRRKVPVVMITLLQSTRSPLASSTPRTACVAAIARCAASGPAAQALC